MNDKNFIEQFRTIQTIVAVTHSMYVKNNMKIQIFNMGLVSRNVWMRLLFVTASDERKAQAKIFLKPFHIIRRQWRMPIKQQ